MNYLILLIVNLKQLYTIKYLTFDFIQYLTNYLT